MITLLALLCAALAGVVGVEAPADLEQTFAPRRIALLVGIDDYRDAALGDLRYAAKDATDLETVLTEAGDFDTVERLSGTVTALQFWEHFRALSATLSRDDTFLVFIAAHGTVSFDARGTRLHVLTTDSQLDRASSTGINVALLEAAMGRLPARRRVLALDTCHSGDGRSALSEETADEVTRFRGPIPPPEAVNISRADIRLYSAHLNQPAIEDDELENGIYTHFLVRALSGEGDADGDGLVEVIEAHDWARDQTMRYTGGRQVPWMRAELVGREAIYLAGNEQDRRQAEHAILSSLSALPAQAELKIDGVSRGAGAIPTGWHHIEIRVDGELKVDKQVRVRPTDALNVARLVHRRERQWLLEAGGGWVGESDWLPAGQAILGGWWLPPDPGQGRLALGTMGTLGVGSMADRVGMDTLDETTWFPSGQGMLRAGWWWGDDLTIGPVLDAGVLWRLHPEEAQGTPAFAPGMAILTAAPAPLALHSRVLVFPSATGTAILPTLTLTAVLGR